MAPRRSNRNKWLCSKRACKSETKVDSESPVMNFTPKLHKNRMQIRFGKHSVLCLVDTGAEISAISQQKLTELFHIMWRKEAIPQKFKDATIIHLFKRKWNPQVCDNHRGISLLSIAGKILARVHDKFFS